MPSSPTCTGCDQAHLAESPFATSSIRVLAQIMFAATKRSRRLEKNFLPPAPWAAALALAGPATARATARRRAAPKSARDAAPIDRPHRLLGVIRDREVALPDSDARQGRVPP